MKVGSTGISRADTWVRPYTFVPHASGLTPHHNMQDILEHYKDIAENEELFSFWEQELLLRNDLRQTPLTVPVMVDSKEGVNLLYRSLYFAGRKFDFFKILFKNLRFLPVMQWLVSSSTELMDDFWQFLPWYILNHQIKPGELEFIARIYKDEYAPAVMTVINIIDEDSTLHLLSKTANPGLRQLLKDRQMKLRELRLDSYYGLEEWGKKSDYPTLYGDKVELIREAIARLQDSSADHFRDPYAAERFLGQIDAAQLVFKCGLLEDSLAFLLEIYSDYQQKNRLVEIINDQKIYKELQQLLRTVIPVYSLIYEPLQAYDWAHNIYKRYFPLISPEAAPLEYLKLWETLTRGFEKDSLLEVLFICKRIDQMRPAELPLLIDEEIETSVSQERLEKLFKVLEEKLAALPHESFITMELIRLLQLKGVLKLEGKMASRLLGNYVLLWKWLPSSIFMHDELLNQIAPLVDDNSRYLAQRIVELGHTMNKAQLKSELSSRPQLFRKKGANIRRDLLAGQFMGVL